MYSYVFFDLDGTLTDPAIGITNAVMYALRHYGIEVADRSTLYPFIGPPLTDSFENYFGFSKEKAIEAVEVYREYFSRKGIFENRVYDGVPAMLQALCDSGVRAVLATSKPLVFADRILAHFGLKSYFYYTAGSELSGERVEKAEVIRYALENCRLLPVDSVVMVGDRSYDVAGAAACGLPAIGVSYGYGSREELQDALYIADSVEELQKILLT